MCNVELSVPVLIKNVNSLWVFSGENAITIQLFLSKYVIIVLKQSPSLLCCPVCGKHLALEERRYICSAGHSFDLARQGYVNLLQSRRRQSRHPGDNNEMVQCRRRFLAQGYYAAIATLINQKVRDHLGVQVSEQNNQLLDVGCGEGYYLQRLLRDGSKNGIEVSGVYGLDISKSAIIAAARLLPGVTWMVGSAVKLPFHSRSLDVVLCVFSRICAVEFARVLKPGGILLIAVPGEAHLLSLRKLIYDKVRPHQAAKHEKGLTEYFVRDASERVNYELHLNGAETILDLLAMTPYYWSISAEKKATLAKRQKLDVSVDVNVISLRLNNTFKLD